MSEHPTGLSYSHSRWAMMQECERRYAYHYYIAAQGRFRKADSEARHAFTLKALTTMDLVIGQAVHRQASRAARAVISGMPMPSYDEMFDATRKEVHRIWQASKDVPRFIQNPKDNPIYDHAYYGQKPSNTRLLGMGDKIRSCIDNLRHADVWQLLSRADPHRVIIQEGVDLVTHRGMPLYAILDLLWVDDDGVVEVTDFKTGDDEGVEEQLALYIIFAIEKGLVPPDAQFRGRVVRLKEDDDYVIDITPADISAASTRMEQRFERMRMRLVDGDAVKNKALPLAAFPPRPDVANCRFCTYREVCNPESLNYDYAGPIVNAGEPDRPREPRKDEAA